MQSLQLSLLSLTPKKQRSKRNRHNNSQKLQIIKPISQHIECLIGGNPRQEDINPVGHHKDSTLEIAGAESHLVEGAELFVVVQVAEGVCWDYVLFRGVLAACVLGVRVRCVCLGLRGFWAAAAYELAGERVYFVLTGYDQQVAAEQGLL